MVRLRNDFRIVAGEAAWFLRISIKYNGQSGYAMTQEEYAKSVVRRFKMDECRPVDSPLDVNANKAPTSEEASAPFDTRHYRSAIGALLHLSKWTRPDLSYAVNFCARAMSKPTNSDWVNVKRILRYIKGTTQRSIHFLPQASPCLTGYSDSDYANCPKTRKSISGFVFLLGTSPISWKSSKQEIVATSTLEAEYIAGHLASQEALFLGKILKDFLGPLSFPVQFSPVTLRMDNQGALAITHDPAFHKRTKHIYVKYHALRERQQRGIIAVEYVSGKDNPADLFTKPLAAPSYRQMSYMSSITAPGTDPTMV